MLKDMKLSSTEAKDTMLCGPCDPDKGPKYPYGLELSLDDVTLQKLGMTSLPAVNTEVVLAAKAVVTRVNAYENQEGKKASLGLQITALDVEAGAAEERTREAILFGEKK